MNYFLRVVRLEVSVTEILIARAMQWELNVFMVVPRKYDFIGCENGKRQGSSMIFEEGKQTTKLFLWGGREPLN